MSSKSTWSTRACRTSSKATEKLFLEKKKKDLFCCWARGRVPLIQELRRQKQAELWGQPRLHSEFQGSQSYTRDSVLKRNICNYEYLCMFISGYMHMNTVVCRGWKKPSDTLWAGIRGSCELLSVGQTGQHNHFSKNKNGKRKQLTFLPQVSQWLINWGKFHIDSKQGAELNSLYH